MELNRLWTLAVLPFVWSDEVGGMHDAIYGYDVSTPGLALPQHRDVGRQ